MAKKSEVASTREVSGEKTADVNGSKPDLGGFSIWKALSTKWDGSQKKLDTEFRRKFSEESEIHSAGIRFYLITEEEGDMVLEEAGLPITEFKDALDREVTGLDDMASLAIADFDISDPDADGNKALSLVLEADEDSEGQHPQEAREQMLEGIGAGELELPDLELTIEIGTIAGRGSRRDFEPVMNAHMPRGKALTFGGALLSHMPPQSSPNV